MENNDDFTFCQVGVPVESDGVDAQKVARGIGGIVIKDESTNDSSSNQNNGILWKDRLSSNAGSRKQAAVGSLSFNVTDASTRAQVSGSSKQVAGEDSGSSGQGSKEQKTHARKSAPRAKVPFEKGYSQMAWLKLTRTHPDLAGLKGQSNRRLVSMNEVKQHQTEKSMWTVLKGRVYNITPYMKFHPGGVDMLMKAVGKDCTALFNKYHAWVNADFLLEKCLVGILDDGQLKERFSDDE